MLIKKYYSDKYYNYNKDLKLMNKIIFSFLISLSTLFLLLILYLGTTEIIVNPKLVEKELFFDVN